MVCIDESWEGDKRFLPGPCDGGNRIGKRLSLQRKKSKPKIWFTTKMISSPDIMTSTPALQYETPFAWIAQSTKTVNAITYQHCIESVIAVQLSKHSEQHPRKKFICLQKEASAHVAKTFQQFLYE